MNFEKKTVSVIILSHYLQREGNLKRIIDDLMNGSISPYEIVIFIDNPKITFDDKRATIIRSSEPFLPRIRFALGTYFNSDYLFFIDDDLSVREKTLENFLTYANDDEILGYEGSILGNTDMPYANDTSVNRRDFDKPTAVDIVIRTYFLPPKLAHAGLLLQQQHQQLPKESLDDVFLCLGNQYVNGNCNVVIPCDDTSDLVELDEGGVGQSREGIHYQNRNYVCRYLMDQYEKTNSHRS